MPDRGFSRVKEATRIARALSHPVRLQILDELRDGGAYVMHLTAVLGRPQANVSQHLMVLREAGLVTAERDGMTVIYHVRDPRILTLVDQLLDLAASRLAARGAEEPLEREELPLRGRRPRGACRCPRCRDEN